MLQAHLPFRGYYQVLLFRKTTGEVLDSGDEICIGRLVSWFAVHQRFKLDLDITSEVNLLIATHNFSHFVLPSQNVHTEFLLD